MREILFRGRRTDNGEWIEGYLVNGTYYLDDSECTVIIPTDATFYPRCEISFWEPVIPSTVGQFTGMLDKNGKKIFEGDIVRAMMDYGPAGMIETVVDIGFKKHDGYRWNYFDLDTIEIIGNIHDNPELLKGE